MASVSQKTVGLLCLLLILIDSGIKGESVSQDTVEKFTVEDGSMKKHTEFANKGRQESTSHEDGDEISLPSSLNVGDVIDDKEKNEEDEEDQEEKVEFLAVITEQRHNDRPRAPCRRHQQVTFDTPTATSTHHFNAHSSTFNVPLDGLFTFSVKIRLRRHHLRNELDDIHIITERGQNVVCSISKQNDDGLENKPGLDSVSVNSPENVNDWDEVHAAKWDFEGELRRLRKTSEWDEPPKSFWEVDLKKNEAEGFCKGVKHLHQGDKVFVRRGTMDTDNDKRDNEGLDTEIVSENDDKYNELCDIVGGFFSGSLFTRDI